jgi:hypothetical protein
LPGIRDSNFLLCGDPTPAALSFQLQIAKAVAGLKAGRLRLSPSDYAFLSTRA